jgi:uridine kinase
MNKLPLAFVAIALALSGCGEKTLTLKEVRNPTPGMLGEVIVVEGYLSSSDEQDLLSGEMNRFTDLVDLAMFTDKPKDQRYTRRMDVGRRLSGKRVSVHGLLKVGPYGMAGRSTVYIEVQSIAEAPPPAE